MKDRDRDAAGTDTNFAKRKTAFSKGDRIFDDHLRFWARDQDVWSNFDKSVVYMKEVAEFYESTFVCSREGSREECPYPTANNRKPVSKAHLGEAHNQAQQAVELLSSNLLNTSMTIINDIESQVGSEYVLVICRLMCLVFLLL